MFWYCLISYHCLEYIELYSNPKKYIMANYRILGNAIVSNEELQEKTILGKIENFNKNLSSNSDKAKIEFSTGIMTAANIETILSKAEGKTTPFTPIGPGKPLTVQIRHLYTGQYPKKGLFDKTKDMIVTSAMKSIATFNAAPRAINFLTKDVQQKHGMSNPAATEDGTPLIHYTPALTETNTLLTIEIGFDEFPNESFDAVGNALSQAAGIPLFISASTHLLAASSIIKLAGNVGSRFLDKSPVFKATEFLAFSTPGTKVPVADFRLIVEDDVDVGKVFKGYILSTDGLVDIKGSKYKGDTPYVIISLDGRKNDSYNEFIPTAASAVVLEKFYNLREGQGNTLDPLVDAIKIYNDYKFRRKADKLKEELNGFKDKKSKEYKDKEEIYNANISNILDDLLKPKS